ncbi:MAG: DNA polymerase IV [Buchananella hordeovulneris]|nr:DNA polymerase IV [Buchananella hordeovulneris]
MSNAPRSANARRHWGDDDSATPILHLDMDAFFASVEELDFPALKGRPVAVGGRERGVISAANYAARAYGVRSAMPTHQALAACPGLILRPGRFARYSEVSGQVMKILREATYLVEQVSVDEAYLDVSGARRTAGTPVAIATELRRRIRAEVGVPASVGVGSTKLIAKLASAHAKPDGLLLIPAERSLEFLHCLPVGAVPGIGAVTAQKLLRREINTVGDLARLLTKGGQPRPAGPAVLALLPGGAELERMVGHSLAESLARLVFNEDRRRVSPGRQEKSLGRERTFAQNLRSRAELAEHARRFAFHCAALLRASGQVATTVAIKLRDGQFQTITRSRSLQRATNSSAQITQVALALLDAVPVPPTGVRLLGVRVEGLRSLESGVQAAFDDDPRQSASAAGMDQVHRRFGVEALMPAALLGKTAAAKGEHGPQAPTRAER